MTSIDPGDILFSTPTLNADIPHESDLPAANGCVRMHEDNWCQFEFVAAEYLPQIAIEVAAIEKIWTEQSVPVGGYHAFRNVHVRSLLPRPINIHLSPGDLGLALGLELGPLCFLSAGCSLDNVVSARIEDGFIYAQFAEASMIALGLHVDGDLALTGQALAAIEDLVRSHRLVLVHWCSRTVFDTPEKTLAFLRGA